MTDLDCKARSFLFCFSMEKQNESVSLKCFKKWPFHEEFEERSVDGRGVWAKRKVCSKVDHDTYVNEASDAV